jgi:acyl-CoA reductase-like NAD-dependent aldehyde dehydrogenase
MLSRITDMTTTCTPDSAVAEQVGRARTAGQAWAERPVRHRLAPVRAFRHLLDEEADRLCAVLLRELGKQPAEALGGDLLPTAAACVFLERQAARLLRPRRIGWTQRPLWLFGESDVVHRRPHGVVGIIGTWNYPVLLNGVQVLQALTAGNAVVWKPSEVAPATAEALVDLFRRAGFAPDLVGVLPANREMGPALAEADVDHVVFTGSVEVGRRLAARLGQRLVSSTLELSGCDAQLVLDDADVRLAARAAWFGTTLNRGQTCIAVRRAFVHRHLYNDFCEALRPLASAARPVRLALGSQVAQAERLVEQARADGARLLIDAPMAVGDECRPTVVVDARPEMALCREALFAPVMAVLPFDTVDEALAQERRCPLALAASIFTRNLAQAERIAAGLRAGCVTVNEVIVPTAHPATPFGGRGDSGWGVTQGAEGLLAMTVPQVVSVKSGTFRPHYDGNDPAHQEAQAELMRSVLQAGNARSLSGRLGGWWRVLRRLWRGV